MAALGRALLLGNGGKNKAPAYAGVVSDMLRLPALLSRPLLLERFRQCYATPAGPGAPGYPGDRLEQRLPRVLHASQLEATWTA
eukprot:4181196-Pyramimonas_sp.AAC.1